MRKLVKGKHAARFPFWNRIANHGTQYPISSFKADPPAIYKTSRICRHSRQSVVSNPPAFGWWGKVESTMWIRRNDGAMLLFDFYQRGYSQNPSLAILKELHRPGLLTLSHWEMTRDCHFWLQILDFYKWKPGLLKSLINGSTTIFRV